MDGNESKAAVKKGFADDLRQMGVVTKYEFLKHLRSRRMLVFTVITVLLISLITALNLILDGKLPDDSSRLLSRYLGNIDLVLIIGVSLFFASTIAAEFEERTALLMFPRPIKKTSFFMGKVFACYLVCGLVVLLYYAICMILSLISAGDLDMNVFGSLAMAMLFMFGAGGFALLLSSLFKKGSTAVIMTIAMLLLIFNIVDQMLCFFDIEPAYSIVYAAKDISNFIDMNPHINDMSHLLPPGAPISLKFYYPYHEAALVISVIWGTVLTTISAFLFKRREF